MSRTIRLSVLLGALLSAPALRAQDMFSSQQGPTPAPRSVLCVPGAQQSCACGGGAQGYQVCAPDGMSLMACACPTSAIDLPRVDRSVGGSWTDSLRLPISFTERPLTLPRLTLRPILRIDVWKGVNDASRGGGLYATSFRLGEVVQTVLGAQFGVTDDFEVGAELLPIELAPEAGFGDLRLSLAYRLARGGFDMGLATTLLLGTGEGSTSSLTLGFPMRWRGPSSRTDLAVNLSAPLAGRFRLGMNVPLMVQFAINEVGHLGFNTGISLTWTPGRSDFDRTVAIPLGLTGGFTVRGPRGPLVDVDPYLQFPAFLNTFLDKFEANLEHFALGVNASVYLYL